MNNIEKKFVLDSYNKIANHFDNTRHYIWPNVKEFIDTMESCCFVADIGCGNGKNMSRNDCFYTGIDFCREFADISYKKSKNINTIIANCRSLPLMSDMFDYVISIAVIHHFYSYTDRLNAINELIRIAKKGGQILIQVWGFDSKKYEKQDAMVSWILQKKYTDKQSDEIVYRFYHLFIEDELKNMIPLNKVKILKHLNIHNNWLVILEKL